MRGRLTAAVVAALTGVLWASAADAASVQTAPTPSQPQPQMKLASRDPIALDRSGRLVNLNLGGIATGAPQPVIPFRPSATGAVPPVQLNFARGRNIDLYGTLFPSASGLRSTYMLGSSTTTTGRFSLTSDLSLDLNRTGIGFAALNDGQPGAFSRDLAARLSRNLRSTQTLSANLNWNFAEWGGLGLTATHAEGSSALLGVSSDSLAGNVLSSNALGVSARVGFGEGWVTSLSYTEGVTQLDLSGSKVLANADPLHMQAYGIGVAKQGLFGSDALGIAVSRPLDIYTGVNLANLNALTSNLTSVTANQAHESDVELGYVTTFLDGSLALQANAAYQLNPAGIRGQSALTGLARAKLNF